MSTLPANDTVLGRRKEYIALEFFAIVILQSSYWPNSSPSHRLMRFVATPNDVFHPVEGGSHYSDHDGPCSPPLRIQSRRVMGSVREYIMPSSPPALVKLRHRYIPLLSRTERDTPTMVHPLLRPTNQGEMTRKLDFAQGHSMSSTRGLGHKGCVNEAATSPLLPSLAIIHPMLPSPVVIQTSGD
ncbi:uncharacterized protein ARMOST_06273 [Armillaria ostoyae]|uniref:Uncharacterized protein n=1 Tax=Armillaria ostoyae TaxID=47428 RepID=A0A284R2K3_ARMOS|nr:uncharacterized protein ARMOST_06273 [Armillaria ostoyae]